MAKATIDEFTKKALKKAEKVCKDIKVECFTQAAINTRVDTGLLAGNWQLSNSGPIRSTTTRLDPSHSLVRAEVQSIKGFGSSYLTNNLDYAEKWNEVDGIVDGVRAQFPSIVRFMAQKHKI